MLESSPRSGAPRTVTRYYGGVRELAIVVAVVAGCYSPPREAACSLTCNAEVGCPSHLECNGGQCTLPGGSCGGGGDAPNTVCYGREIGKGLLRLCFDAPPTEDITLPQSIVTSPGSLDCTVMREGAGPEVCVVAGRSITIEEGETITARGLLPLVLVASSELVIAGVIDAAGRTSEGNAPGANTNASALCPTGQTAADDGGGAGGSFGERGGAGGKGTDQSAAGGKPGAIGIPSTAVRGGCSGQAGQNEGQNAGQGGGAVYLIAGSVRIAPTAIINASGGGGGGAMNGSGGGGGGSGGLIGIDTRSLVYEGGVLVANGGGGGCGVVNGNGTPGADPTPTMPQVGAPGCVGAAANTGQGGAGASAGAGKDGDVGTMTGESGDGGGGSVGEIVFFSPTAPDMAPGISPPRRHVVP